MSGCQDMRDADRKTEIPCFIFRYSIYTVTRLKPVSIIQWAVAIVLPPAGADLPVRRTFLTICRVMWWCLLLGLQPFVLREHFADCIHTTDSFSTSSLMTRWEQTCGSTWQTASFTLRPSSITTDHNRPVDLDSKMIPDGIPLFSSSKTVVTLITSTSHSAARQSDSGHWSSRPSGPKTTSSVEISPNKTLILSLAQ